MLGGWGVQKVEIGVTMLYQLGEGAPDEALKPGSGSLGALAAGVPHKPYAGMVVSDVPAPAFVVHVSLPHMCLAVNFERWQAWQCAYVNFSRHSAYVSLSHHVFGC
jgi:hypothetical protein